MSKRRSENIQPVSIYVSKQVSLDKPAQWEEMDNIQGQDNLDSFKSDISHQIRMKGRYRKKLPNNNMRKQKKASQVQQYQKALTVLRKQNKHFCDPFGKHKLNISLMQAIKILRDAIEKDKDFTKALRAMGCKTRMRVRNKSAAKELFQVMLEYLQDSKLPQELRANYQRLLRKRDEEFQINNLDQKD